MVIIRPALNLYPQKDVLGPIGILHTLQISPPRATFRSRSPKIQPKQSDETRWEKKEEGQRKTVTKEDRDRKNEKMRGTERRQKFAALLFALWQTLAQHGVQDLQALCDLLSRGLQTPELPLQYTHCQNCLSPTQGLTEYSSAHNACYFYPIVSAITLCNKSMLPIPHKMFTIFQW